MFCHACGKEISKYDLCGRDVSASVGFSHFDQKTGEQWFSFGFEVPKDFLCDKSHHLEYNSIKKMKNSNIPYRKKDDIYHLMVNDHFFVSGKYVKNSKLIIGKCDHICCPLCGAREPSKVGCFIASAIYGSYNAPEVIILRDFRDQYLLTSKIGNLFVKIYYFSSPYLVKLLNPSIFLKNIIRNSLLNPFVKYCNSKVNKH